MITKILKKSFAKPNPLTDKIRRWTDRLNLLANTPQSKTSTAQLNSLINFYIKKAPDQLPQINWSEWQAKITTQGLVKRLKANFEQLDKQEYDVESIASRVTTTQSKALQDIRNELNYHTALWLVNYSRYLDVSLALENYTTDISFLQANELHPELTYSTQELVQTHNYIPGSKDDINLYDYVLCQFDWGKKVISFYRHPADEFKSFKATKNVLGR